jgi:very-short-patch-repair endonuclease
MRRECRAYPKADAEIGQLAEAQHGVVARRQLRRLGLSEGEIERRVGRGYLIRVHQGVYAVGHRLLTQHGHWMAAVLACGEDAVLSHRSAAALLGIAPRRSIAPEVSRPARFRKRPGIACHQQPIAADEWETVEGIPCTGLSRTLLDLAAIAEEREVERALHEAEVQRLTDRVSVPHLLRRYPRRRGTPLLRRLLTDKRPAGTTRNDFEEGFVAFLDRHRLPRPIFNGTLSLRGRLLSPDCMWPEQRLIVELDSRGVHDTDKVFESDRLRDRHLLLAGWRWIRVTWRQLHREPAELAADLREALAEQSPHPHPPGK